MTDPIIVEEVTEEPKSWPSWANEVVAVLLAAPAIMAFVPGLQETVTAGFVVLESAPTWYLTSLGVVVAAILGIKALPALKR